MSAVRDPALIYLDGVLCCFHSVGDPIAIRPGVVTSGDVWVAIKLCLWASQLSRSSRPAWQNQRNPNQGSLEWEQ